MFDQVVYSGAFCVLAAVSWVLDLPNGNIVVGVSSGGRAWVT